MKDSRKIIRRRYEPALKAQILRECEAPGASVASVAMLHGINANVVHKWRRMVNLVPTPLVQSTFVPVELPRPVADVAAQDIRVELRRGATAMTITWPVSCAGECAVWMRELLR